jgi:diguanylate cyclase (GGDEF)-like protein/PAS domain S-box-containing protein
MNPEREKYLTIFETIPNPVFILDVEGRIENVNNAAFDLFRDVLPAGVSYYGKAHISGVLPWLKEDLEAFVGKEDLETTFEKDVETRKGLIHFQIKLKRMPDLYEKFVGTIIILNDISYLKQAERTVARARDFHLTLFEEFPAQIWRAGIDGKCNYVNKAWLSFTGKKIEEETGDGWILDIHDEDKEKFKQAFLEALKIRDPFETEFRIRRHDGRYRWALSLGRPFNDLDGGFAGYIGSCTDIQDRKAKEEDLIHQATHDSLTGLPNRRLLETDLPRVIARTGRGHDSVVLFMDLDQFKNVNDTYGHNAGDQVLIDLSKMLLNQFRKDSDRLTRLGGDEFAILFEDTDIGEAGTIAQRLCESVANSDFLPDRGGVRISLSVGLARIKERETPEAILSRADKAMYRAKELGGNRIIIAE